MKPNYRFDRAERTRSKEAKKMEKRAAQEARRANRDAAAAADAAHGVASPELNEDHDAFEHAGEKED